MLLKIKASMLSLLCFMGLNSSASGASAEFYTAVEMLKEDLAPNVKTLQRAVKLYHWGGLPDFAEDKNLAPSDPAWAAHYTKRNQLMADFFLSHGGSDMAGPGMYFSADPYKSREYGDTLVEVTIAKGVSFLDIRSRKSRHHLVRKSTIKAMENVCGDLDYMSAPKRGYFFIRKDEILEKAGCRHIFNQALSDMGVQFYAYRWKRTKRFGVCNGGYGHDYDSAGYVLGGRVIVHSESEDDISMSYDDMQIKVFPYTLYENKSTQELKDLILAGDEDAYSSYYVDYVTRFNQAEGRASKFSKEDGLFYGFKNLYPFMQERLEADMLENQIGCGRNYEEDRE